MIVVGVTRCEVEDPRYPQEGCLSLLIAFSHISEVRKPKQLAGLTGAVLGWILKPLPGSMGHRAVMCLCCPSLQLSSWAGAMVSFKVLLIVSETFPFQFSRCHLPIDLKQWLLFYCLRRNRDVLEELPLSSSDFLSTSSGAKHSSQVSIWNTETLRLLGLTAGRRWLVISVGLCWLVVGWAPLVLTGVARSSKNPTLCTGTVQKGIFL